MTQGIKGSSSVLTINSPDLGPTTSLQLMFAKLQLELAETAKFSAKDKMTSIQNAQDDQKQVADLLNVARQKQADAKTDKKETAMSDEMVKYMDDHNLPYDKTNKDHLHTEEEWKTAITALEGRLEQIGTNTQQQMVYVQDFMGQYNSYLQGANAQIGNSNQTLTSLAKGM